MTVDTAGGTPSVGLLLGGTTERRATYRSGTPALVFEYTLTDSDGTHTSVLVPADSLELGGGTIHSTATQAPATLTHLCGGAQARVGRDAQTPRDLAKHLPEIHDPNRSPHGSQQPTQHNGSSPFKVRFEFSHNPAGLSYKTVRDQMFDVTGGTINKTRRLSPPSNLGWELRIVPTGSGEVTLSARATTDCTAQYAACDTEGRKFDGALNTTIAGPPSTSPRSDPRDRQPDDLLTSAKNRSLSRFLSCCRWRGDRRYRDRLLLSRRWR